jgi:hypothetical protein
MATFWRTFHHDGKFSLALCGWGVQAILLSLYLQAKAKLWCKLQLRSQIYVFFSPLCSSLLFSVHNSNFLSLAGPRVPAKLKAATP